MEISKFRTSVSNFFLFEKTHDIYCVPLTTHPSTVILTLVLCENCVLRQIYLPEQIQAVGFSPLFIRKSLTSDNRRKSIRGIFFGRYIQLFWKWFVFLPNWFLIKLKSLFVIRNKLNNYWTDIEKGKTKLLVMDERTKMEHKL